MDSGRVRIGKSRRIMVVAGYRPRYRYRKICLVTCYSATRTVVCRAVRWQRGPPACGPCTDRGLSSNGTENLHRARPHASSMPVAPGSRSGRSSPRATMSGIVPMSGDRRDPDARTVWRFPRRRRPPRRPCVTPSVAPLPKRFPSAGLCVGRHSEPSERGRRRGGEWRGVAGVGSG